MAEPEEQEQETSEETEQVPSVDDLAGMTEGELYELSKTLSIKGRTKMGAEELRAACRAVLAAQPPAEVDPGGQADRPEEQPLTVERFRAIAAAKTESLEMALGDPKLTNVGRDAIERELNERRKQEAAEALRALVPEQHYRVTKGGRYVAHGAVGHLAEGSVLTRLTHDLVDVKRQGIVYEPTDPPSVAHGMLGEQITRFR